MHINAEDAFLDKLNDCDALTFSRREKLNVHVLCLCAQGEVESVEGAIHGIAMCAEGLRIGRPLPECRQSLAEMVCLSLFAAIVWRCG